MKKILLVTCLIIFIGSSIVYSEQDMKIALENVVYLSASNLLFSWLNIHSTLTIYRSGEDDGKSAIKSINIVYRHINFSKGYLKKGLASGLFVEKDIDFAYKCLDAYDSLLKQSEYAKKYVTSKNANDYKKYREVAINTYSLIEKLYQK